MRRRRRDEDPADLPIHRWTGEQDGDEVADWTRELLKRREELEAEPAEAREEDLPIELRRLLHKRKGE